MDPISVEEFLAPFPPDRHEAAETLRALVRRTVPDAVEAVRPGWRLIGYAVPAGRREPYFGYIAPEMEHVHLGFEYGIFLDDPDGVLEGVGRQVRYVTLRRSAEIRTGVLENLVRQAARVATMGRSRRLALLLDRDVLRPVVDNR